jgi:hypothetical protein
MKKLIKKDGITRGEVTISPQLNIPYHDITGLGRITEDRVLYQVSGTVGYTNVISIHNVLPSGAKNVAMEVEDYVLSIINDCDTDTGTIGDLLKIGYTI